MKHLTGEEELHGSNKVFWSVGWGSALSLAFAFAVEGHFRLSPEKGKKETQEVDFHPLHVDVRTNGGGNNNRPVLCPKTTPRAEGPSICCWCRSFATLATSLLGRIKGKLPNSETEWRDVGENVDGLSLMLWHTSYVASLLVLCKVIC